MVYVQKLRRSQRAGGSFGLAQNSTFLLVLLPHLTVSGGSIWAVQSTLNILGLDFYFQAK